MSASITVYQIGEQHLKSAINIQKLPPTHFVTNIHYFEWSKLKQNRLLGTEKWIKIHLLLITYFERKIRISTMFCSFFQYFTHSLPMVYGTEWKFISPVYYDNFAFFQGGQDILIRVKFLIFLKKTGNFGSGNLNHKLSPRTCLFHNRDSHLFNDKNLWKTRELRLFFFNIQPF